jgi:hypothetical protein
MPANDITFTYKADLLHYSTNCYKSILSSEYVDVVINNTLGNACN